MPSAKVSSGYRIHYETHGSEGPWVVLLMGLGASSGLWGELPSRLASASRPCRVLTIDNRGTGRSDAARRPFLMQSLADDAVEVMTEAGVERAFVLGVSMGGMIAQHVAIRHPHRVLGLGLLSTTPSLLRSGLPAPSVTRSLLAYGLGIKQSDDALAELLLARTQRHRGHELAEQMKTLAREERTTRKSFFAHLGACLLHDTAASLARITVPTVIVAGEEDAVLRPGGSRILAARIPNATLELVRDAGHGLPFTDPDVLARMVDTLRSRAETRG